MDRHQVNVRLTSEQMVALDQLRISLQPQLNKIPSRSDVVRMAVEMLLANPGISEKPKSGSRVPKRTTADR